ncbi:MAG: hypothetical protein LBD12_06455 [Clostridiales Family XIII bacterium]|nr:hypothetical protein [Clostridiales Family XIII bacterium]
MAMPRRRSWTRATAVLVAAIIAAVGFFTVTPDQSHAAVVDRITLYKGQTLPLVFNAKSRVNLKSSNTTVIAVKRTGSNKFSITVKKAGKATLTATANRHKTETYAITAKTSYPAGAQKNPLRLGNSWATLKSKDGKKQIDLKTTIWKGEAGREQLIASGVAISQYAEEQFWNNEELTATSSFYLIRIDYQVVKGFTAKSPASFTGLSLPQYNQDWKIIDSAQFKSYGEIGDLPKKTTGFVNGATGSTYVAVWVDNSVRELRARSIAGIADSQDVGSFGKNPAVVLTGCTKIVLP